LGGSGWPVGRDLNTGPPKYEGFTTTQLRHSVQKLSKLKKAAENVLLSMNMHQQLYKHYAGQRPLSDITFQHLTLLLILFILADLLLLILILMATSQ
jgi:hypothetical protein